MKLPGKNTFFVVVCLCAIVIGETPSVLAETKKAPRPIDKKAYLQLVYASRKLNAAEAKKLEEKYAKNPDDLKTIAKLFGYYQYAPTGRTKENQLKHRQLLLNLIAKYPENPILSHFANINVRDKNEYEPFLKLWKKQIEKSPDNPDILWNAASCLMLSKNELVESCLLKGEKLEKDNPRWPARLGLYYSFCTGKEDPGNYLKAYEKYKTAYEVGKNKIYLYSTNVLIGAYKAGKYQEMEKYAHEISAAAEKIKNDPKKKYFYTSMLYEANISLGLLALENNKIDEACACLLKAGKFADPNSDMSLAYLLFMKNRKETVLKFLNLCAKGPHKGRIEEMINNIKDGISPNLFPLLYLKNISAAYNKILAARRREYLAAGKKMSATDAKAEEKILAATPLKNTYKIYGPVTKLVGYYYVNKDKDKSIPEKRRQLIYRIIEYFPRYSLLANPETWLSSETPDKKLIALCKTNIAKYPDDACILLKASCQLTTHDNKLAEQCLKKCQEVMPESNWKGRFDTFHARVKKQSDK